MSVITNLNNIDPVKKAFSAAKKSIHISSGWIRSYSIKNLFSDLQVDKCRKLNVKILIRISKLEDVKITDIENFLGFVNEIGAEVRYTSGLHAKVNIVDDIFATVGSFNITGTGYSKDKNRKVNEIGMIIEEPEKIKELLTEYIKIWENAIPLKSEVLGFVLNAANNRRANFIGIKEIEYGKFVEIESVDYENRQRRWIGKILTPQAFDNNFFQELTPEVLYDQQFADYIEALNKKDPMARFSIMTAILSGKGFSQLRTGVIEIKKEIVTDKKGRNELFYNRVAIPSGAMIKPASREVLQELLGFKDKTIEPVGKLAANEEIEICLDFDEILTKHMSVFGTTGSGKSYFTKRFISKFYPWIEKKKGRIVIIDTHGEYEQKDKDIKNLFKKENNIKEIDVENIKSIINKKIISDDCDYNIIFDEKFTESEIEILKDAYSHAVKIDDEEGKIQTFINQIKKTLTEKEEIDKSYIAKVLSEKFEKEFTSDKALDFIIEEYFEPVLKIKYEKENLTGTSSDTRKRKTEILNQFKNELIEDKKLEKELLLSSNKIKIRKVLDKIYKNEKELFSEKKLNNIEQYFSKKIAGFKNIQIIDLIKEPAIYNLNLKYSNDIDERRNIVANVCELIFNEGKLENGKFETLIVVEEAHNFAPQSTGKGSNSTKILEKIASEGRKFNIGLLVVTQRPAFISKGVIAQCNTNVIFRMINNADLNSISELIESFSKEYLYQLPAFEQGQCIITGVGIRESNEILIH